MKTSIVVSLIAAGLTVSCSTTPPDEFKTPERTDVRVSAAVQADIEGLAGVRLALNPTMTCEGHWDDAQAEGVATWAEVVELDRMVWSDGARSSEAPKGYTELLAETVFVDVDPGCYELFAQPVDADGELLSRCVDSSSEITVEDHASLALSPQILCGETPRMELSPAEVEANLAPEIDALKVASVVSPCEIVKICATARDPDFDMVEFAWPEPLGLDQGPDAASWPTIVYHAFNEDRSVTQCIGVQAEAAGSYDVTVNVYDLVRPRADERPSRIEEMYGGLSVATESVEVEASLDCAPTGRSAVILMTLADAPSAPTLIENTLAWLVEDGPAAPRVLVVLDDNHRGEDEGEGEFILQTLLDAGYASDYMLEPPTGLEFEKLSEIYSVVWLVNPSHGMDDVDTHTALLRFRQLGGGVVLQGDDISRFRANPRFMEPLTYLRYEGNGTVACGESIEEGGETYRVSFFETEGAHPVLAGLEGQSFSYGGDIDLTEPRDHGELVLAWASYESPGCVVRTPAVVTLDPDKLTPW
ncbi:hypothetical protein ENSA5_44250 [Enhygromyxa salina]|uniref:Uncharacterized protein n=1 Tax=Enhygromyxa salina TaxID=215803 RepID=A0A2S9XJV2_9BACT|nr:hypothetical protein [Enhygromyxa salina]PRP93158.1 hypothetical protein ENSA5_44250 [Enhygromyxa salina]